jgi:hypothetical protein
MTTTAEDSELFRSAVRAAGSTMRTCTSSGPGRALLLGSVSELTELLGRQLEAIVEVS